MLQKFDGRQPKPILRRFRPPGAAAAARLPSAMRPSRAHNPSGGLPKSTCGARAAARRRPPARCAPPRAGSTRYHHHPNVPRALARRGALLRTPAPPPRSAPGAPILALRSAPLDAEGTIRRYRPSFSAASGDRSRNSMGAYPGRFFAAPSPHQTTLARPSGHQCGTRFDVAASVVRILYTYQVPASGTRCARPRRGCTSGGTSRVGIRRRSTSHDRREADRDRMQVIPPVDPYCICDGSIGRFAPNGDGPCGRGDAPIALQICGGFRGRGKANFLPGVRGRKGPGTTAQVD